MLPPEGPPHKFDTLHLRGCSGVRPPHCLGESLTPDPGTSQLTLNVSMLGQANGVSHLFRKPRYRATS